MIRLITLTALAASLLLWSAPANSASPHEFSDEVFAMADPSCRSATHSHQQWMCGHPQCRTCSLSGHRHAIGFPPIILPHIGLPCPMLSSEHGLVQRLSGTCPPVMQQRPIPMATVPIPVGPPPSSFAGGFFMPQRYQQVQPGYGYSQGHQGPVAEQRIVYVPYAAPPPIHVQRFGGAVPRPPLVRRILGDANTYEYPEMPIRTYTTRGPRDFLAPNPPGIGY